MSMVLLTHHLASSTVWQHFASMATDAGDLKHVSVLDKTAQLYIPAHAFPAMISLMHRLLARRMALRLSVCLSVTLVECNNKKGKRAHYRIGRCLGYMRAKADPNRK